jgi:hypothetical protein
MQQDASAHFSEVMVNGPDDVNVEREEGDPEVARQCP